MAIYRVDNCLASAQVLKDNVCAFGVFDGVHIGHQFLIDQAIRDARRRGVAACALTFDQDPDELFRPSSLKKLMTNNARIAALAASGVDDVVVLSFGKQFAALLPDEFLTCMFADTPPAAIHLGYDAHFGARAAGDVETLQVWARKRYSVGRASYQVVSHDLLIYDGMPVTSTRIRALLAQGLVGGANSLLGKRYRLKGRIVEGRQMGRHMGFRTANLSTDTSLFAIGEGVYAAYAYVDGSCYKAAVSVGVSPSFTEATSFCEAHLLDFIGDLYGRTIELEFCSWLRPMKKFDDIDKLIAVVQSNIAWVREHL